MKYCPVCEKTYDDNMVVCAVDGATLKRSGPPDDPLLGQTIKGRYRVLSKLGAGGMGAVYLAEQVSVSRKVALKVLLGDYARDESFVKRFRQEARLAASLNHRSVVTIHEFDQAEDGSLFIAMEYLSGKALSEVIRQEGTLAIGRAIRLGLLIAEGLRAAHQAGVIHRDVKPQNIMVVGGGHDIKLMDFGIARLRDSGAPGLTRSGVVIGTPNYMAPEQIQGGEVTERTDIYAFGVVLYEMLSGGVPFSAGTAAAILAKHLQEAPVPLRALRPEVPPHVERIVMQALEKDPQARQQDMGQVVEALRHAGAETGGQQVPVTGDVAAAATAARGAGGLTAAGETRVRAGLPAAGRFPQTVAAAPTAAAPAPSEKGRPQWKLFAVGALLVVLLASVAAVVWFTQLDFRGPKPAPPPTAPTPPGGSGSPDPTPPIVTPPPSPIPPRPPIVEPSPPPVAVTPAPRPLKGQGSGRPLNKVPPPPDVIAGVATTDPLQIRRLVEEKLRGGGFLKGAGPDQLGVTVAVSADRIVTLTGVLRDRAQKDRSVRIAREVPGVRDVKPMINLQESWKSEPD